MVGVTPRRDRPRPKPVLVLAFALSMLSTACVFPVVADGVVRATGVVRDALGRPVSGARVYLARYPDASLTRTADDGGFALSRTVAPGRYTVVLVVEAPGCRSAWLGIATNAPNHLVVTLQLDGSEEPSRIIRTEEPGSR